MVIGTQVCVCLSNRIYFSSPLKPFSLLLAFFIASLFFSKAVPLYNWISSWVTGIVGWVSISLLRMFPKDQLKSSPQSVEDILGYIYKNYAYFHVISGDDPNSETIKHEIVPSCRSGHRIFTTHDFLFCIGGYDAPNGNGLIHKEIWRMNLLTKQWILMELENPQNFPEALASFAICQTGPLSNKVILYGGTSIPFGLSGQTSRPPPYLLTMLPDGKVKCEKIDAPRGPRGVYGHAMVRSSDSDDCKYYVVGGTTGRKFYLDIHCLSLSSNGSQSEWKWEDTAKWKRTGDPNGPQGLFRLECIIDNKKMLIFGGGEEDYIQGFDKMYCYDFEQKRFIILHTKGDPNGEGTAYPAPRKCHSVVQYGRKVILAGGCGIDDHNLSGDRYNQIYGDVWIFDLDSYGWTKHHSNLSIAVFFHAAAITLDGCLLIHGGVCSETSKHRTNTLQAMWISTPNILD